MYTVKETYENISLYYYISDLTNAELEIKKAYCNDVLSSLDTLGSGDSIKKGNLLIFSKFVYKISS